MNSFYPAENPVNLDTAAIKKRHTALFYQYDLVAGLMVLFRRAMGIQDGPGHDPVCKGHSNG